ncbi:DSBA oxidoreductase [Bacillus coahuilensis m2-6]|uniref:DSBA oxidoreductase n=1 Tax=Bacillus coahuilensis p1.1.43 TaxID=1150625 RepID=A0A147KB12_9BACI|nr:DsbA family oxidoreductase [Bacillus coahuilensis]KUP08083.1 DSBA oxidoreductase [Bacillus coahuilensis p1.1.43]KUP09534.1 DSBA oxidoreductase [Bacillus coahuilensis m2-6]
MQVEVWSDFVCPFCYIGKRRLEKALETFPHKNQVEVIFRSFELDPNAPKEGKQSMAEILATKYRVSLEQAKGMCDNMAAQAKQEELDYYFDTMIPRNSFDAHRVVHYASKHGKMNEMSERLFYAFFTESKDIANPDTLVTLASEVGLDGFDVLRMLTSDEHKKDVRNDEVLGSKLGIKGVPFFIFNKKYAVSGAQPLQVFQEVLEKSWNENKDIEVVASEGEHCTADSCDVTKE